MSLEALAERTWKVQRVLVLPLVVFGGLLLVGGLVAGVPLLSGFGVALALGGGYGMWRLNQKAAAFNELLANPHRVARIVPIVQRVQGGIVTHYPVVVVADDGATYRIATWQKSVPEAVAPFLQRFPNAKGFEGDSVFAPDDGMGQRFKIIGLMLGSLLAGAVFAALLALPATLSHKAKADEAYERRVARNEREAAALKAVEGATLTTAWSACSVDSLEPSISVLLSGAKVKSFRPNRSGYLSTHRLSLDTATERMVFRVDALELLVEKMLGSRRTAAPLERELGIVGARVDDTLKLRLLDLDDGTVLCEGVTRVAPVRGDSAYEENEALAVAVSRPFCRLLSPGACESFGAEPGASEPVDEPAAPSKPSKPAIAPPKSGAPAGGALDRASIQATVRAANAKTRYCYEKALTKKPSLQGTLNVSFVIGGDGRVTSAQGTGFPDAQVSSCVAKVFSALRFPRPQDGKLVPVKYPIVFQPAR